VALPAAILKSLRALDGVRLWPNAPLAPFTTIGTGGKADLLVTVNDVAATVTVLELLDGQGIPWICLGAGSNFLVADEGYAGVIVKLGEDFQYVKGLPACASAGGDVVIVTAGAAAPLARLAAVTAEAGLAGLDFACGIPGTVGGAVAMNAGAYGRSLVEVLDEVQMVSGSGVHWLPAAELDCGYRYCNLPAKSIVTAAQFKLAPSDADVVLECHRSVLRRRRGAHPQGVRTFGSTFKNPSGGGAGRLIEAAGLKGVQRGGAEISRVHANFLVNLGDATTADVLALMSLMRQEVERSSGVVLEPEVRLIGCRFPWQCGTGDPEGLPDRDG
jgi:UDP-N-acetylmuramate dehydrogenase